MAKKLVWLGLLVAVLLIIAAPVSRALAQTATPVAEAAAKPAAKAVVASAPTGWGDRLGKDIAEAIIYSIMGLVILLVGFKALDFVTPFSLNKEIAEDDNTAAGVVVAGMMISLGLIIAAAIS